MYQPTTAAAGPGFAAKAGSTTFECLDMHTNQPTQIKDRAGNVVGSIEILENGDEVLRDTENKVRGTYEAKGDHTRDAEQNIVAKGNKLRSMIC